MANLLDTPQLAFPFMVDEKEVRLVEQDEVEDLEGRVMTCLLYELGQRPGQPDYGISDQAFRKNGADVNEIVSAVARWVPEVELEVLRSLVINGLQTITINIKTKPEDSRNG